MALRLNFRRAVLIALVTEVAAQWDPWHRGVRGSSLKIRICISKCMVAQMPKHWICCCKLDVVGVG